MGKDAPLWPLGSGVHVAGLCWHGARLTAATTPPGEQAMYAMSWIIRFQGTITQGPNAGRSYRWENSWGGVQFDSLALARAAAAKYKALEPAIPLCILSRQFQEDLGFVEVIVERI
jgi:hypothetical protein